ncbi:Flp family type IVb pilin [Mesorhizobium sp. B2-1-8]|uniref:Flp family type IVb pilin n=1 Tax=Mesorhizobium sp. B2-1-8 TaxID=2589967 RepID=UPI0011271DDF|nr:Flp family type IVb pilin [Mesorhizobium sp. B2-1-8]UCI17570.1 Flp family type IVb pilin [Mesorhizobium sp. B2-1-8]
MTKLISIARAFRDEESGAAMVEYSILIGIIAAASILIIIGIGVWVTGQFTGLCTALNGHGATGNTACAAAAA